LTKFEPTMDEARKLALSVLISDANYRRDRGAFGEDDRRTKHSAYNLRHNMRVLRSWYSSRFGSEDLQSTDDR
jgi:hypothetical protein